MWTYRCQECHDGIRAVEAQGGHAILAHFALNGLQERHVFSLCVCVCEVAVEGRGARGQRPVQRPVHVCEVSGLCMCVRSADCRGGHKGLLRWTSGAMAAAIYNGTGTQYKVRGYRP